MEQIDIEITENPAADAAMTFVENITDLVGSSGFTFTKRAMGGYLSASLNFTCDETTAYRMLNDYAGKRIVFTSPYAKNPDLICWEGLVYTITVTGPYASVSRSMADVYNRVEVQYSIVDVNVNPPAAGASTITAQVNNTASQAAYGIRHIRTSAGAMTTNDANALRNLILSQLQRPRGLMQSSNKRDAGLIQDQSQVSPANRVRVSIDCAGFWETLDRRFWSDAATTVVALDTIIRAILNPSTGVGQMLSADQTDITANSSLTRTRYFPDQNTTAQNAIETICGLGDSSGAFNWACGIGPGRKPYYRALDFTRQYATHLSDPSGAIYDENTGEPVAPWLVEPGYLMWVKDLLPDGVDYADETDDVRNQMIDEVTFIAPSTVTWRPRPAIDAVNLRLARLSAGIYDFGFRDLFYAPPFALSAPFAPAPGDIYGWTDALRDLEKRLQEGNRPADVVGWPFAPEPTDGRIAQP